MTSYRARSTSQVLPPLRQALTENSASAKASLDAKQVAAEVERAGAIIGVADQIIQNAKVKLAAATLFANHGAKVQPLLPQIGTTAAPETPK